jgi:hypothetical protein
MIYPWKPSMPGGHDSFLSPSGVIAYLELDNRKCTITEGAVCFPTANEVRVQECGCDTASDRSDKRRSCG